jgi:hypothetical protein
MSSRTVRLLRPIAVLAAVSVVLLAVATAAFATASSSPQPQASPSAPAAAATPTAQATPMAKAKTSAKAKKTKKAAVTASTITCSLSAASVLYGATVTVSGTVSPAAADLDVAIAVGGVDVGTVKTDASGQFSAALEAKASGAVSARLVSEGVTSSPAALTVLPKISTTHATAFPFLGMLATVTVTPASYNGVVTTKVIHHGKVIATLKAKCSGGKVKYNVPVRGIGAFTLRMSLPAAAGLGSRSVDSSFNAAIKVLKAGSKGQMVKGMLSQLQKLAVRVPGVGTTFTAACNDSVMAFQKAYRLKRTYVFDTDDWKKLDTATLIKPKYSSPSTHIEIDKTRQILMVVKGGVVRGYLPVSTGLTNNTPTGAFNIQQMHPTTVPLYGSGVLTWVMGFIGNFAVHGYPEVPTYPASHGCVREPLWVAYWTYTQSFVGERIYLYY